MKAAAYLYFDLNAKEAIDAYRSIFEAKVVCEYIFNEGMTQNDALLGKVFHAELKIGDLNLYLCDTGKPTSFPSTGFVVEIKDENKAKACLDKLVQNGKLISGFKKMPFGPTIAHAEDAFGIRWDVVIC